jgi:predicted nucleic acid-binding protein
MLLLDTSFVIELEAEMGSRRSGPAQRFLAARPTDLAAVSIVTIGEFAEGFEKMREVEAFLSRFRVVPLSRNIAYRTAALQSGLPRRLGENDAWIAATALDYDASLVGRDQAFERIPRLKYVRF